MEYRVTRINQDELYHFGVKGMKWGHRRYQNKDGSYKPGADGRYDDPIGKRSNYYGKNKSKFRASNGVTVGAPKNASVSAFRKVQATRVGGAAVNGMAKLNTAMYGHGKNKKTWKRMEENVRKETQAVRESEQAHRQAKKADKKPMSTKKKVVIGAAVAGTIAATYGAYKLHQYIHGENAKIRDTQGAQFAHDFVKKSGNMLRDRLDSNLFEQAMRDSRKNPSSRSLEKYDKETSKQLSIIYNDMLRKEATKNQADKVIKKSNELGDMWFKNLYEGSGRSNVIGFGKQAYDDYVDLHSKDNFYTAAKNVYNYRKERKARNNR